MSVLMCSVVVRVDADLDESAVDDVVQYKDRILSQSRAFLPASSQDQTKHKINPLDEILHPLGLETRLVVLEHANGIALYFICMTLSAIMSLRDQWRSVQLRRIVQSLFTFLSGAARPVRVKRLTWPLSDYEQSSEFFSSVRGKQTCHIFGPGRQVTKSYSSCSFCCCIGLSRYIAITTFSNIAAIAAFCRISPPILNRFTPNLQA